IVHMRGPKGPNLLAVEVKPADAKEKKKERESGQAARVSEGARLRVCSVHRVRDRQRRRAVQPREDVTRENNVEIESSPAGGDLACRSTFNFNITPRSRPPFLLRSIVKGVRHGNGFGRAQGIRDRTACMAARGRRVRDLGEHLGTHWPEV